MGSVELFEDPRTRITSRLHLSNYHFNAPRDFFSNRSNGYGVLFRGVTVTAPARNMAEYRYLETGTNQRVCSFYSNFVCSFVQSYGFISILDDITVYIYISIYISRFYCVSSEDVVISMKG